MTIKELKAKREHLARANRKEYERMGNTQRCQDIFKEICKIDEQIKAMSK